MRFLPPAAFLSKRKAGKLGARRGIRRSSPPGRYPALLPARRQDVEYRYDAYFRGRPNGALAFVALRPPSGLARGATYRDWHEAIREALPRRRAAPYRARRDYSPGARTPRRSTARPCHGPDPQKRADPCCSSGTFPLATIAWAPSPVAAQERPTGPLAGAFVVAGPVEKGYVARFTRQYTP